MWVGEYQGHKLAVKVLRVYSTNDLEKITGVSLFVAVQTYALTSWLGQRFCKEVVTWKALHHPNVLLLLGVTMTVQQFAMVPEWMENGSINEFIKTHKDTN